MKTYIKTLLNISVALICFIYPFSSYADNNAFNFSADENGAKLGNKNINLDTNQNVQIKNGAYNTSLNPNGVKVKGKNMNIDPKNNNYQYNLNGVNVNTNGKNLQLNSK